MTNFSDEDTDRLIELIRQHPALFNSQLDSYRDENLRDNIWKVIGEGINKTDSKCRKKWKLIKDSYNRYKRKQKHPTGSAAPAKNSKWHFFERLRFLDNTPSQRQSSTNIMEENTTSEVADADTYTEVTHEIDLVQDTPTPLREVVPTPGTSITTQERSTPLSANSDKPAKKILKRNRQDDEFIKFLKERQESRNIQLHACQQPVDEISTFSKHIEMSLRKLSERSKAMAKNEIFSIISKYEMADIDVHLRPPNTE
ncbi:hypothetical protein RI129_000032 [Pyrocoelia pectoralis]|uniref:Transcription factor Adf-1 n=1 Tax=Pyrocoelia pectoralis TaxID=417401 RepID=A0AAN7US23_9COLE